MSEDLEISNGDKAEKYSTLVPQIEALISGEPNLIANLANVSAALKAQFDFLWVGFYIIEGSELVLGPFQGPIACTRIQKGKGVCGAAWEKEQVFIVPDVDAFSGHIACSSASKSEIVLPFYIKDKLFGVLDVDSEALNAFDDKDEAGLKLVLQLLAY